MDDKEAVIVRHSRRAYLNQPLDSKLLDNLAGWIETINVQQGLSIRAVFDRPDLFGGFLRSYGLLNGVRHFLVMAGPKNDSNLFEKLGFFGEHLVLEMTKANLGTCWVGGSFDQKKIGCLIQPGEQLAAVITFGHTPPHDTPREQLIHGITHRKKHALESILTTDGSEPAWFHEAMDFVLRSPSAVNGMPSRFYVTRGTIQCGLAGTDPLCYVDLGIAKAQFNIAFPTGIWEWGEHGMFRY